MKNKFMLKTVFGILTLTIICLNFIIKSSGSSSNDSYYLLNIQTLQASAGEAWCDPVVVQKCEFYVDGVLLQGIGVKRTN